MENFSQHTLNDLIILKDELEINFKSCQEIIKQAYEEMKNINENYTEIIKEIDKRNGKL